MFGHDLELKKKLKRSSLKNYYKYLSSEFSELILTVHNARFMSRAKPKYERVYDTLNLNGHQTSYLNLTGPTVILPHIMNAEVSQPDLDRLGPATLLWIPHRHSTV